MPNAVTLINGTPIEAVGFLPDIIFDGVPEESIETRIARTYAHGGGWMPMSGFTMDGTELVYEAGEGEERYPMRAAFTTDMDSGVSAFLFDYGWVAFVTPDQDDIQVIRMD